MGTVNRCKHMPSCSTYSKESIKEQGLIVGGYLTIIRILKCNPFNAPKVDMPLTTMDVDRC
jgi:putative membrane protein insertion efficiency factor